MEGGAQAVLVNVDTLCNRRRVRVTDDSIFFEVYRLSCDCVTCRGRMATITKRLEGTDQRWSTMVDTENKWSIAVNKNSEGGVFLVVTPEVMPADVPVFLSGMLKMDIHRM